MAWQIVEFSGQDNENLVTEKDTYREACKYVDESYPDTDEREELRVDILRDWSTEY